MNKLLKTDNPVTNTLNAVVEQAIQDYLMDRLYLYRITKGEDKILKTIERIEMTVDEFWNDVVADLKECRDFFMEGDYKALYDNRSGEEVIAGLNKRFIEEVIPEYERTGKWSYKKKEAESE